MCTLFNKDDSTDTEARVLDLHLTIFNGFVSSEIKLLIFRVLDGDVPRAPSYDVYISELIRFTRVSSNLADFNARNKTLTA